MTTSPPDQTPVPFSEDMIRRRMLVAMRAATKKLVASELRTPEGITTGHIMVRLMDYLIAGEATWPPADPAVLIAWVALSGADAFPDRAAFERQLPEIITREDDRTRHFLSAFYASQFSDLCRRIPEAAGGVGEMYRGGKTSTAEEDDVTEIVPQLTPERLTAYLRARFPEHRETRVKTLTFLPGGMTKQTIKVTTETNGVAGGFVLRKDMPNGPNKRNSADEFPTLSAIWQAKGVTIAQPLWAESDPGKLGTPAMAVAFVEGSGDISSWAEDPTARDTFCRGLARDLARLHTMPLVPTAHGPTAVKSTPQHVADEIGRWYDEWRSKRLEPHPVLEAVFRWLYANIPDTGCAPANVHGDIGFHNLLMKDGRITAFLDWEFFHTGDPAEDLVYCRPFVEQAIDWQAFLAEYERHGGRRPDAATERFYSVWGSARNAAGCAGSLRSFMTHDDVDMRLAVAGLAFLPRFEMDAFAQIVNH